MLGLNGTIDQLTRYRRRWETLAAAARAPAPPSDADPGRLVEVGAFGADPGNLRMLTHRPDRLPASAPLVVALHGCLQTAAEFDRGSGWSDCADRHGFALLCPEQRVANNPRGCFNWFEPEDTTRGSGEVASIRGMIERMVADHGLDRRRIFVTGLSAGGAMAAALLATYPELFAGGAIIAGLPYGSAGDVRQALDAMFQGHTRPAKDWGDRVRGASPHAGPWPAVSIWHGTADSTVTPLNAAELAKQWTDVHGLSLEWSVEERARGHLRRVWRSRWGEELVTLNLIDGMVHGAPIDPHAIDPDRRYGRPAPFFLDAGISSTDQIARAWGVAKPPADQPPVDGPPMVRPPAESLVQRAWRLIARGAASR